MSIYKKMFEIQSEVERIKKDKNNPHFKHNYADVNSVLDEVVPKLHEKNILLLQPTFTKDGRNYLKTKLVDIDDDSFIETDMILQDGLDAQKTGSALTYYRRYELVSLFGLQTVDDDGKAGSSPVKEKIVASEETVLEIEALMNGNDKFKTDWLNFLGVKSFDKASQAGLEKAIKQIKGK